MTEARANTMNGATAGATSQTGGVTGARRHEHMGHGYWRIDRQQQMGQQERWRSKEDRRCLMLRIGDERQYALHLMRFSIFQQGGGGAGCDGGRDVEL